MQRPASAATLSRGEMAAPRSAGSPRPLWHFLGQQRQAGAVRIPALLRPEDDGVVTIYTSAGALVRTFAQPDVHEPAEARHLLGTSGVRTSLPRELDALCLRLDGLIDEQEAAARDGDRDRFVELSLLFHRAFVEVSGNRLLLEFADRLQGRQGLMLRVSLAEVDAHDGDVVDEHRRLVESSRRRDLDALGALLRAHMGGEPSAPRLGLA